MSARSKIRGFVTVRGALRRTSGKGPQPNLDGLYVFAYRLLVVVRRNLIPRILYRWPGAAKAIECLQRFLKKNVLPARRVWLQVESGLCKGLWMHLLMPDGTALWRGEHERDIQDLLLRMVQPGDCVYDVGSELGSFALGLARIVGQSGYVVAFEADPHNVLYLREHTMRNQMESHLRVVHAAVWSHIAGTEIPFRKGKGQSHGGVETDENRPVLGHAELIRVPVQTLDNFIAAGERKPQVVKIDVEGGESEVLRGASEVFARQRPLLIVEVHHQKAADEILAWLEDVHYSGRWSRVEAGYGFPQRLVAWPVERHACI